MKFLAASFGPSSALAVWAFARIDLGVGDSLFFVSVIVILCLPSLLSTSQISIFFLKRHFDKYVQCLRSAQRLGILILDQHLNVDPEW